MAGATASAQLGNPCYRPTSSISARESAGSPFAPGHGHSLRSRGTTMTAFTVGYFVGSLAANSLNRKLATALTKLAPRSLTMREIPIRDLPLYSYDYDADYPPPG